MISTNNLYYSAFLLSEDLSLQNACLEYDEKLGQTVVFYFSAGDEGVEKKLSERYGAYEAITNIRKYLDSLVTIRDIAYRMSGNRGKQKAISKNTSHTNRNNLGRKRADSQENFSKRQESR